MTGQPIASDGYTLNPAGCVNMLSFRGDAGPVHVLHGRTNRGAALIGVCDDLWHDADALYAAITLRDGEPTPPAWSVGWLPVDCNPPTGYVPKWRLYEITATPFPLDKNAVTIKTGIAA